MSIHVNVGGQNKKTSSSWMKINGEWKKGVFWNNVQGVWKKHETILNGVYVGEYQSPNYYKHKRATNFTDIMSPTVTTTFGNFLDYVPSLGVFGFIASASSTTTTITDTDFNVIQTYTRPSSGEQSTFVLQKLIEFQGELYGVGLRQLSTGSASYSVCLLRMSDMTFTVLDKTIIKTAAQLAGGMYTSPNGRYLYVRVIGNGNTNATHSVFDLNSVDLTAKTITRTAYNSTVGGASFYFTEDTVYVHSPGTDSGEGIKGQLTEYTQDGATTLWTRATSWLLYLRYVSPDKTAFLTEFSSPNTIIYRYASGVTYPTYTNIPRNRSITLSKDGQFMYVYQTTNGATAIYDTSISQTIADYAGIQQYAGAIELQAF